MYIGINLTNGHGISEALSNAHFDNCYLLKEDVYDCETVEEAVKVVNSHEPLYPFELLRDNKRKTILHYTDMLGNEKYLELLKEV